MREYTRGKESKPRKSPRYKKAKKKAKAKKPPKPQWKKDLERELKARRRAWGEDNSTARRAVHRSAVSHDYRMSLRKASYKELGYEAIPGGDGAYQKAAHRREDDAV